MHPVGNSVNSIFFEDQEILTEFYNGDLQENIF